jgi:hypothetical protein
MDMLTYDRAVIRPADISMFVERIHSKETLKATFTSARLKPCFYEVALGFSCQVLICFRSVDVQ